MWENSIDAKSGAVSAGEVVSPLDGLVLLSQSVAAFAEKNHIFDKTHLFSMRRG